MRLALSTAIVLLCWPGASLALSPEQAQAVISKLAYQSRIGHKLLDKIDSNNNWAKTPEFRNWVKLVPAPQFKLNLERHVLSDDLALCKATERFGVETEIAASRPECVKVRSDIDGIEPWNRDKVINNADKMEYDALKLYVNPVVP